MNNAWTYAGKGKMKNGMWHNCTLWGNGYNYAKKVWYCWFCKREFFINPYCKQQDHRKTVSRKCET